MPGIFKAANLKARSRTVTLVALGMVIVLGGWTGFNQWSRADSRPDTVEGSGTIEGAGVLVSAQLPGRILEMPIEEGQRVEKGDPISRLESAELEERVKQARAQLEIAVRQVEQARGAVENTRIKSSQASLAVELASQQSAGQVAQARAAVKAAEANLQLARVALEKSKDDYDRYSGLYRDGAVSEAQFKEVESAYRLAGASYEAALKELERVQAALRLAESSELNTGIQRKEEENTRVYLSQAETDLKAALAREEAARAALSEAEAVLAKAAIYAPIRGTVVNKLVRQGELVTPGTPLVKLVDMEDLELTVYVPGRELGKVKVGQPAKIYSDSFSETSFAGRVSSIAQKAEFTPKNVQVKDERAKMVYAVKIKLENSNGLLKPGMPADAEIILDGGVPN